MNFFIFLFLDSKASTKPKVTTPTITIAKVTSVYLPIINSIASSTKCKAEINVVILSIFRSCGLTIYLLSFFRVRRIQVYLTNRKFQTTSRKTIQLQLLRLSKLKLPYFSLSLLVEAEGVEPSSYSYRKRS